jgi:2-polyprenyl-3-methyl-5-hydroxy-6-metoxy-1,4-benzoquinol methylase
MDLLDVPCGMGWGTSLVRGARRILGIGIDRQAAEEARIRYGHLADSRVGSMSSLACTNATFDVVCCLEGIEHVRPQAARRFLNEARRVLRSHGLLLVSTPYCRWKLHTGNPSHLHEYRPEEPRELPSGCFEGEQMIERPVDDVHVLYVRATRR